MRVALRALPAPVLALIGASAVIGIAIFIWLIAVAVKKPAPSLAQTTPPKTEATPAAVDSAAPPKAIGDIDEPPSISVDSLPVVKNESSGTVTKGSGKLLVAASPWCTLFVDGQSKGPTPVSVEIAAGAHQLRCDPAKGDPKIANVGITDGATARYKFSFE